MLISEVCACGAQIEAPDDLAGQSVKCPQCAAAVFIPPSATGARLTTRAENYREEGEIPADLKDKAFAELGPNEQLVWMGQPVTTIVFRRSLGYLVLGGLVTLASLLWLTGLFFQKPVNNRAAVGKAAPQPKPNMPPEARNIVLLPSAIILCVSIGFTLVPFYRWKLAKRTCYALTNRRALVYKEGLFSPTRESYSPVEVAQMRRRDSWVFKEGGDLIFRTVTVVSSSYRRQTGWSQSVKTTHYGFLAIAHVQDVEKAVRETLIDRFVDKLTVAGSL